MIASREEAAAFLTAREQTKRGACERWLKKQPAATRVRWLEQRFLSDPLVYGLSKRVLASAVASVQIYPSTPFPSMVWYGGARDTYAGHRFKGTFADFVEHILVARSKEVAPKRCGWVVTPTSNTDGHRVNASTKAMHALNLDCDERGVWHRLLVGLDGLGIAYVAYQSGGWELGKPKWHVLLPLAAPFDTSTPELQAAWKRAYTTARVVFGSVAGLLAEGFDPACDTPCQPVFITERRTLEAPPRQVSWRCGRALDLAALVASLPEPPSEVTPKEWAYDDDEGESLDDERFEALVDALVHATASVPSSRRDLYMALPGALLERGVDPDDVFSIVEAVSSSYPRPDAEAHRDNLHCAKTTISRWERNAPVTQIGTLADLFPGVARVLDDAFPEYVAAKIAEAQAEVDAHLARLGARKSVPDPMAVPSTLFVPVVSSQSVQRVTPLRDLRGPLAALRRKKRRSKDLNDRIQGEVLNALLEGDDLAIYEVGEDGKREIARRPDGRLLGPGETIFMVAGMVASKVGVSTTFDAVREIFRPSLNAMCADGEKPDALFRKVERAFLKAMRSRLERTETRHAREQAERLRLLPRSWRTENNR